MPKPPRKDYEKCDESKNGKHEADPASGQVAHRENFIIDFTCKHCGQSGSVAIDPKDINW